MRQFWEDWCQPSCHSEECNKPALSEVEGRGLLCVRNFDRPRNDTIKC